MSCKHHNIVRSHGAHICVRAAIIATLTANLHGAAEQNYATDMRYRVIKISLRQI